MRGVRGGGAAQRGAANAARSKRGATGKKTGLRESIAKGVTRKITYSGFRTGVRVRVDGKYLPSLSGPDQATNKGQWRHPVFGNTSAWVTQKKITPAGWFDRAVSEHGPAAIKRIREAARKKALQELEK